MSIRKNRKAVVNESTLDFPRESLDKEVWARADRSQEEEEFTLAPEAESKVKAIVDFLVNAADIPDCSVNIVGSITSNSYTDDSDIDLHFSSPTVKDAEGMNERLRYMFDDQFKSANSEEAWHIGTHPVEVYFQENPLQDLMSVGCYSFTHKKWLVGPELTEEGFNPYSEYFSKDMKYVNKIIGDIRDMVLQVYERALVFNKLGDEEKAAQLEEIKAMLKRAAQLFENARKMRKHLSSPKSEEEAKKLRNDKKWKVADSAFKLMDKFGYLAILREYSKLAEDEDAVDVDAIVNVVRDNIGPANKKLHEIDTDQSRPRAKKAKVWIDDIREVPEGYIWFKSTDDFISFVEQNGWQSLEVVDIDHDAGDYASRGGDYIRCLDYLEFIGAKDVNVRIHSANAVGIQNMRRIIRKNQVNGWKEVFDIIGESIEKKSGTPNYDRVFSELKDLIDKADDKKLGIRDRLNRGNKCILLWYGEDIRNKYGIPDYSKCQLAWDPQKSWGLVEVQTFPNHKDLTEQQADEAIEKGRKFIQSHSQVLESSKSINSKNMGAEEYAQHLLHHLGADPKYSPKKDYSAASDSIAREYIMEMPTDTAAVEIEMDAVLLLVRSGDEDAIKAGKKLGDAMMSRKGGDKKLLKTMQEAYFALLDLNNSHDVAKLAKGNTKEAPATPANPIQPEGNEEQLDEGVKELMSAATLAGMLAIPGILPAKTIQKSISNNQRYEMIVKDLNQNVRMIGDYTAFQAANIIARTLYAEARNDGEKGMNAVASVIFNRAEGNKVLFTNACLKPKQFSCWNKFTEEEANPKNFKIKIPSSVNGNKKNEALWKVAMQIAADMLADSFKPTTDANMYFNPQKCSPSWDKELKDVAMIGSHKFGILKNHSAFI